MGQDPQPDGNPAGASAPVDVLDTTEAGPRIIRGGAMRTLAFVAGTLASLAAAALLFRHLGVDDTGRYATVLSLIAIAGGMSDAGVMALGLREYSTLEGAERDAVMRNLLGMRVVFTGLGVVAATAFATVAGYGTTMVAGTALAGIGFLLYLVQQFLAIPLNVGLRLGWVASLQFLTQFLAAVVFALLVLAGASLLPFLAAQIPVMIVLTTITVVLVRGEVPLRPSFAMGRWRSMFRDVLFFAVILALGVLYFRVITVLLSLLSTEQETGYYGAAFRVIEVLAAVPSLLAGSAFPLLSRAARDDRVRLGYILDRLTRGMLLVGIWMAVCVVLGAPVAIDVVGGAAFFPSIALLQYLGVALVATFVLATWALGLLACREHKAMLIANGVALVVAVGGGSALILLDGARGGAIALVAAEFSLAIGYGIAIGRHRELTPLDVRHVARVLLAAAAALAVPWLLDLPAVADVVLGTVIYGVMLVALRAIPEELASAFTDRLVRRHGARPKP